MFKKIASLTLAALLTTGLAVAQDPTSGTSQQQQTTVGQPTDMNEPLFKGCVSGTKDNYVLTAEDGRQFRLHSDKDINEYVGKYVEIRGSVKKEKVDRPDSAQTGGTKFSEMDVADIKNVDGKTCPAASETSSMSTEQKSAESTVASTESTSTEAKPEADAAATSTTTEPEKKDEAASSNFYGTEQKPVEQKTDEAVAEVKEESKEAVAEVKEESKEAAAAVENKTEEVKPEADAAVSTDATATQNNAVDANAANTNDQATASDASAQNTSDASAELPQTASPLPLLGLLGLISAGFGFISRRK